ncbi:MAG: hypothetical protein AAFV93_19990 [Chloroflexota bacterium]
MVAVRQQPAQQLNTLQQDALDRAFAYWDFTVEEQTEFLSELEFLSFEDLEAVICAADPQYFIITYCKIYDAQEKDWIPFELWQQQIELLALFHHEQLVICLKARQLGITWLAEAYGLWQMLFAPIAEVLVFSKREDEATYLLGEERLRGMYKQLPDFLKAKQVVEDNAKTWKLSNGSTARAFPTTAGDSYTATLVIVDEADLVPDLNKMMRSIKPTIDAGGKMFMISRSNKDQPQSDFKKVYRAAKKGLNNWVDKFLPWWVRPARTQEWYQKIKAEIEERTGSLDELHEQYPASDAEALAPSQKNKRIPALHIDNCHVSLKPLEDSTTPALQRLKSKIPALIVYRLPEKHKRYAGGLDCAEGLPTSDNSATTWVEAETGEEVANLVGKFTPEQHAALSATVSRFYNNAGLMVENNNHGHAVILWLNDNRDPNDDFPYKQLVLKGHNGKDGWTSNTLGKVLAYDNLAERFRLGDTTIHDDDTVVEIKSIEQSTLRAPEGQLDDRSDSYAFSLVGADEMLKKNTWANTYAPMRARRG